MGTLNRVDTVCIGGSAGALAPLKLLLSQLPDNFPAAVLVCIHRSHLTTTTLTALLESQTRLPMSDAHDGQILFPGHVYVATSDHHMLIGSDHLHLRRGAHENNFRPAIDPLFRSAAVYRGTRAIGIILSGLLDDGAAGAATLVGAGGRVLVLDPVEADYPDMPSAVLEAVPEAHPLPMSGILETLNDLAGTLAAAPRAVPWEVGIELKIASLEGNTVSNEERLGKLTPYNCPHCNGVLWEIDDDTVLRFRCHTGHAYTAAALNAAQEQALDEGLWSALRAHQGRAELLRRLAEKASGETSRASLAERAKKVEKDAERLESIIENRKGEAIDTPT